METTCIQLDDLLEVCHAAYTKALVIFVSSYGVGQAPLGAYRFQSFTEALLAKNDDGGSAKILEGFRYANLGLGACVADWSVGPPEVDDGFCFCWNLLSPLFGCLPFSFVACPHRLSYIVHEYSFKSHLLCLRQQQTRRALLFICILCVGGGRTREVRKKSISAPKVISLILPCSFVECILPLRCTFFMKYFLLVA